MDFKKNEKLIYEAVNAGCQTMAELARYLKLIGLLQRAEAPTTL